MAYGSAYTTPANLSVPGANAHHQWVKNFTSASPETQTLEKGQWYTLQNLSTSTEAYYGFGASAAAAEVESDSATKGKKLLADREYTFFVTGGDENVLCVEPPSGSANCRLFKHLTP
jgi:hypothetical protein